MYHLTRLCARSTRDVYRQEKRFAGHSKWANIRHTKAEKDGEKSAMIQSYVKRMKVAIAEGKSAKPLDNLKLAQIIEEARSKCVPLATINGTLEKAEKSKTATQSEIVDFRGPGNAKFAVKILSDNLCAVRMNLNTVFRKLNCTGFIITEAKDNLDTATDDAITVGAEEVEEYQENNKTYYKFTCDPAQVGRVASQIRKLNYNILTMDDELLPKVTSTLDEETLKTIEKLFEKLKEIDEVVSVFHNIVEADGSNESKS
ncbi:hypothetical protein HCN44_006811 [Aphidius gifuensis]|uniref:Uncharacterized protein n=1 Tax=Aphidius gifuensis TaxID=684658 RepID=A0A835CU30_APHGI|nr:hypothetical protein HCN44_006811 [Aphidius gifuensis]